MGGSDRHLEQVVANGVVYAGGWRAGGGLYGVDAVTGAMLWHFPHAGSVLTSPVVVNGMVFAASANGTVYALGLPGTAQASGIF